MKKLLIAIAVLALPLGAPTAASAGEPSFTKDVSMFEAETPNTWPFNVQLSGIYEDTSLLTNSGNAAQWGTRLDVGLQLTEPLSVGAFYSIAWDSDPGAYHKLGASARYMLPDFSMFRSETYIELDAGVSGHEGEYDPFYAAWLGAQYPLDMVTAGLKADLAVGYTGYFDSDYRSALNARFGFLLEF